mmetsp:Transcript_8033/g.17955  ORF Transcript_8033/g.17955 Transcript_8033/m.17955 type:complete len:216 (-) Transcript_8033:915-1562(-)
MRTSSLTICGLGDAVLVVQQHQAYADGAQGEEEQTQQPHEQVLALDLQEGRAKLRERNEEIDAGPKSQAQTLKLRTDGRVVGNGGPDDCRDARQEVEGCRHHPRHAAFVDEHHEVSELLRQLVQDRGHDNAPQQGHAASLGGKANHEAVNNIVEEVAKEHWCTNSVVNARTAANHFGGLPLFRRNIVLMVVVASSFSLHCRRGGAPVLLALFLGL